MVIEGENPHNFNVCFCKWSSASANDDLPNKRTNDCLKNGADPGTLFACSDSEWINQNLHIEWFKFFLRTFHQHNLFW